MSGSVKNILKPAGGDVRPTRQHVRVVLFCIWIVLLIVLPLITLASRVRGNSFEIALDAAIRAFALVSPVVVVFFSFWFVSERSERDTTVSQVQARVAIWSTVAILTFFLIVYCIGILGEDWEVHDEIKNFRTRVGNLLNFLSMVIAVLGSAVEFVVNKPIHSPPEVEPSRSGNQ